MPFRLTPRTIRSILQEWTKHFKSVQCEMRSLLGHREMYRHVLKMVENNPQLRRPSTFWTWMRTQYVTHMSMGVRRLVDWDKRSLSLLRLLIKLRDNPRVLTPQFHANRYRQTALGPETGRAEFASYARADGALNLSKLRSDIRRIKRATSRISAFVNRHVAHTDRNRLRRPPTHAMLDRALDVLGETGEKFQVLLLGYGGDMTPTDNTDWFAIFEVAWAPREAEL